MSRLTASERKVARTFLAAYPIAGLETLTQLAQRAKVSPPTVMRFVTRLSFEGYPEFQQALRREVQEKLASSLSQYAETQILPDEGVIGGSHRVLREELDASFAQINATEFDAVVQLLADPRIEILCTGGRFSQVLAYYLFAHLNMLRPGCRLVGASPSPRWDELIDVGKRTALVVFDFRRYQNSTIQFARRAAGRRCQIVLFTDPWLSPIADVARHVLTATVHGPSPFDTMVPAFALIETLVVGLSQRLGPRVRDRIAELEALRAGTTWGETDIGGVE